MRIFFELKHTAGDCEVMLSGYEFDAWHAGWDDASGPRPDNVRIVGNPEGWSLP